MRKQVFPAVVLNSLASLAPQISALVILSSRDFGLFSVSYLAFGLASSIVLSALCDAWVVSRSRGGPAGWGDFSAVLVGLSVLLGVFGALGSFILTGEAAVALLVLPSLVLAPFRVGLRYFFIHTHQWQRAIASDLLFIVGMSLGLGSRWFIAMDDLTSVLLAWLIGCTASSLVAPLPSFRPRKGITWLRDHQSTIKPLLADSLTMDAAAVGTPYVLLPFLGLSDFGIYRAVSNLSAPIRLIVAPLRPLIMRSPRALLRNRITAGVLGTGLGAGLGGGLAVHLIERADFQLGVVSELAAHAVPIGLYVFSTALLSFYPLVCRGLGDSWTLSRGRVGQTSVGVVLPIVGMATSGLSGAIWGFAISSLSSALLWLFLAMRAAR